MSKIVVILPVRERFRATDAGAVALCVKEQAALSRYAKQITVIGAMQGGFEGVLYQQVGFMFSLLLGKSLAYQLACQRYIKSQSPCLIEIHNRVELFLSLQGYFAQIPCCLFLHNDPQSIKGCRTVSERQLLLNKAAAIYCVSDYVRQRFILELVGNIDKVKVIYNGIVKTDIITHKQKIVSYAGRLIPEKGILDLVRTMAMVLPKYPEWRFEIIGAYGFGRPLGATNFEQQLFAAAQPAKAQITFLGHQPQTEVIQRFAQSAIVVVPSTGIEAFGRVAIEGMAQGCAVITSASGGLKEVTIGSEYCVPDISSDNLYHAIQPLLEDEIKLQQAQAWSIQQVKKFNLETQVIQLDKSRAALLGEP
jgi:UDP-glucose:(glucosyl)LPS alpha-1,2-glucosyltransferase